MNSAELHVETLRRIFPTICGQREDCLDTIFTTSNHRWQKGRIVDLHPYEGWKKMESAVKKGTAISVEDALRQHHLDHAKRSYAESDRLLGRSVDAVAEQYARMNAEQDEVSKTYRLSDLYLTSDICKGTPAYSVPDDVKPEWLAIYLEFLNNVLVCKIDFTEVTILPRSDYESRQKSASRSPAEKKRENKFAEKMLRQWAEEEGKKYVPKTAAQRKKDSEEWERLHSPRARAEQANDANKESRRIAAMLMDDLVKRGLISTGAKVPA